MYKKRENRSQMLKVFFYNTKKNYYIINITSREITI